MHQTLSNKGISIQKAQEILGDDFLQYSKKEIEKILEDLYLLANSVLDNK